MYEKDKDKAKAISKIVDKVPRLKAGFHTGSV
jgi:hypothetical protein